jgi:CTP:molybdopterin cytidylyltransferase MocA
VSGATLIVLAAGRARRFGGVKPLAAIGPNGEAIVDLLVSDAVAAGFSSIVVVLNPDTGPQIRAHIEQHWPSGLALSFAIQPRPLGTVSAVLAARDLVDQASPFAVVNADDLYGPAALSACAEHLEAGGGNVLVGFRLHNAIVGREPVTRGVCDITSGHLRSIVERRQVHAVDGGFESLDGLEPVRLDPEAVVSMNLWGFDGAMWQVLGEAMSAAADASEDAEVLLPEAVAAVLRGELAAPEELRAVRVIVTESRCVGVTHPGDLDAVRADLATQIQRGERQPGLFGRGGPSTP